VLDVGAGTGAYEPRDRVVTAGEEASFARVRRLAELDLGYRVCVAG
jgi:hypothetical protein